MYMTSTFLLLGGYSLAMSSLDLFTEGLEVLSASLILLLVLVEGICWDGRGPVDTWGDEERTNIVAEPVLDNVVGVASIVEGTEVDT